MAKTNQNEPWLLTTAIALAAVVGIFYAFLFPKESLRLLTDYWHIITPTLVVLAVIIVVVIFAKKYKGKRAEKQIKQRNKQIKLAEQLIWRSRYNLESQKAQILADDTAESREKWQQVKRNYIKTKLYPVVSETDVPLTMASALIENTVSFGIDVSKVSG